jgi:hypothetical protein
VIATLTHTAQKMVSAFKEQTLRLSYLVAQRVTLEELVGGTLTIAATPATCLIQVVCHV